MEEGGFLEEGFEVDGHGGFSVFLDFCVFICREGVSRMGVSSGSGSCWCRC